MPINILMPALSPTMEKGNLAKWLKKEGEAVKTGDVIAEIETDKATMEYEAIEDGVMAKIVVPEGTNDVPVNQLIAVLAQEGEDPKAAASAAGKGAPAPKAPSPLPAPATARSPEATAPPPSAPSATEKTAPQAQGATPQANGHGANRIFSSPTRSSPCEGSGHRSRPRFRFRAARPCHRPRCGRGEGRQGAPRTGRSTFSCRSRCSGHRTGDVGPANPRALRRGQLRTHSA